MEIEEGKVDRWWMGRWVKDGWKTEKRQSSHPSQGGQASYRSSQLS